MAAQIATAGGTGVTELESPAVVGMAQPRLPLPLTMRSRRWSLLALAAAGATAATVALAPLSTTGSCAASSAGETTCSSARTSLLAAEGPGVLAVLAVPVLVTLVPALWPTGRARWAAATLLTLAGVIALASAGILLLPTATLAWAAVAATRRQASPPHPCT